MDNTSKRTYLEKIGGIALLTVCVSVEAGIQDIERGNDTLMRQYLGREAERAGLVSPSEGNIDRTEAIEAGGSRELGNVNYGREGTYSPATDTRLMALFEKRKLRAAKGDIVAQLNLGLMYFKGEGTSQNGKEAARWLQRPADQGYAEAQYVLAELYSSGGGGVTKSYEDAAVWYRKAAEQGLGTAQYKLGTLYAEGYGVRYNAIEAEKWLTKAAEGGDSKIQFNLAERYANGQGVRFNPKEAEKWYRTAAMQGDPNIQFFVGRLYRNQGDLVVQNREEAMVWFNKAAEKGHAASKASLGVMYLNGEGIPVDMVQAYKWLSLAATSDNDMGSSQKILQIAEDKEFMEEVRGTSREYLRIAEERMSEEQIKEAKTLAKEWQKKYK